MIVEVCVDSVESAAAAQQGGADRVELCAALIEGGITPSLGSMEAARRRLTIGINMMVRPRGGDFLYSDLEFEIMCADIEMAKRSGANGVVIGLLNADGSVDLTRTLRLVDLARPLSVTFHRAFDMSSDPFAALEALVSLGVDRVLTSGQEASAGDGIELLRGLVTRAAGRIVIMPGGGIHERNIERVVRETGAREVHVTGTRSVESGMRFRNTRCFMGGELRPPEFSQTIIDAARVQALVRGARST